MRKRRLLIIGCGDVARRALPWLARRFHIYALCRNREQAAELRALGVIPVPGDLDEPATLQRLAGLAEYVLHSAPPPNQGDDDARSKRLAAVLAQNAILARGFCYISTSGVYGDCAGALLEESQPAKPQSARALRRVVAEQLLRRFGRRTGCRVSLLRAPGIYAAERLPTERLRSGTPALLPEQDGYSNHIHADDLAHACCLALFRGRSGRVYHVCDDSQWKMGDWFDRVADASGLPRPQRLERTDLQARVSPALWSFMRESRRLSNRRLKEELKLRLRYPTPQTLLDGLRPMG
ncbi:SDR family oxidoreductase [Chitinimonas arctica]|uniref:SDR family oxidoreductase n=1 Tax=Chitinimonas arctica TaxID=2594795 RepID=A0A516SH81_9NEIS|nr:SDR family oxidoreductase [Chitinimonas arctica]QDQ27492.1 SDR family oxidoreductase [Chitinimonas arctica]